MHIKICIQRRRNKKFYLSLSSNRLNLTGRLQQLNRKSILHWKANCWGFLLCCAVLRICASQNYLWGTAKKSLHLKNILFYRNGKDINQRVCFLLLAELVSITFKLQKSNKREEILRMHRSGVLTLLLVRAWSDLSQRIKKYPGATGKTTSNWVY